MVAVETLVLLTFNKVNNPLHLTRKTISERLDLVRSRQFFTLLTWKCALRHNIVHFFGQLKGKKWPEPVNLLHFWLGNLLRANNIVHFFDIWKSKSGPNTSVFTRLTWEMCFAPQHLALFRHLKIKKWSEHVSFLHVWLGNVLRASSRHNSVHFLDIWTSKSGPRLWCFVHFDLDMCFAPTTACTSSTSERQKVVQARLFFTILTWKCA